MAKNEIIAEIIQSLGKPKPPVTFEEILFIVGIVALLLLWEVGVPHLIFLGLRKLSKMVGPGTSDPS